MPLIWKIGDLLKQDLPGSMFDFDVANYNNLMDTLKLRVRLVTSKERGERLLEMIEENDESVPHTRPFEYIVNEMQYEVRRNYQPMPDNEKRILNAWCGEIVERAGEDAAIDFFVAVVKFRKERIEKDLH
jgi:hypothetical protein